MATSRARSCVPARAKVALVVVCLSLAGLASSTALAQTLEGMTGQVTSTVDDILSTGTDEANSTVGSTGGTSGSGDTSGSGSGGTSSVTSSAEETTGGLTGTSKKKETSSSSTYSSGSAFADACGRQVGGQNFGAVLASVRDSRGAGDPSGSSGSAGSGGSEPFAGGVSGDSGSGSTAPEAAPLSPIVPPSPEGPAWLGVLVLASIMLGLGVLLGVGVRSLVGRTR